MVKDWTPAEDLRPGLALIKIQPEHTPRGDVWTQIVCFNWPAPGVTQMTIREWSGQTLLGHGRVYPIPSEDHDDGA